VIKEDFKNYTSDFFPERPKVVISNDSLYFFTNKETQEILLNIKNALSDEGIIIINYPSLAAFRGIHDISVGIDKRKSKKELEALLKECGYKIIHSEYWPFLLSPVIFTARVIQRLKLKFQKNVTIHSDVNLPPYLLNKLFYHITKLEYLLSSKPWGSSLFIIAKK
jgi:hypothetical protein